MEKRSENSIKKNLSEVFIVSDNIISSLGFTTSENMEAMLNGKSGIIEMNDPGIYPEPFQASAIDKDRLNRLRKENDLTEYTLFESLIILSLSDALKDTKIDLTDNKFLLIFSSTKGDIEFLSGKYPPEKETYLWYTAQRIADFFGITTTPVIISNACISGVAAVETAARLLRNGSYKHIAVIGADSITGFTVSGFQSFKSISSIPCKPYDMNRDGLSVGEGVSSLILTSDNRFLKDKHEIRILGGALSNDANHISGPSRTGDGLYLAIENAVKYAGISKQDIDFMNLHGTATVYNDEMESKAIRLSNLSGIPVNGLKGFWGHTLGASGIMEIIACVESLKRKTVIGTKGFDRLGTPEPLNIVRNNTSGNYHTFLKTASGFGGVNAAIIISDKKRSKKEIDRISYRTTDRCKVENNRITVNDSSVFSESEFVSGETFLKSVFKNLQITYPKFYKTDNLSKLGFIAVQYLFRQRNIPEIYDGKKIALVFSNSASSLDTDIRHRQTINDPEHYFPSPAVFVYTLPNIVSGEICIKEKIQGETIFFISEKYDPMFIDSYIRILFEQTDTDAIIAGYIDYLNGKFSADIFSAERE